MSLINHAREDAATVLVVVDVFLIRFMVSDALQDAGLTVLEASNADEALLILRSGVQIDLVFSDVQMPGVADGLELLAHLREFFPAVPVIITSGYLAAGEALSRGAAKFLEKPYSPDDALEIVKDGLSNAP